MKACHKPQAWYSSSPLGHWAYISLSQWQMTTWPAWRQTYHHFPSRRASPPFIKYQIILLSNRGMYVNNLAKVITWSRTHDLFITNLAITPPHQYCTADVTRNIQHYFLRVTNVPISFFDRRKASSMRAGSSLTNLHHTTLLQLCHYYNIITTTVDDKLLKLHGKTK